MENVTLLHITDTLICSDFVHVLGRWFRARSGKMYSSLTHPWAHPLAMMTTNSSACLTPKRTKLSSSRPAELLARAYNTPILFPSLTLLRSTSLRPKEAVVNREVIGISEVDAVSHPTFAVQSLSCSLVRAWQHTARYNALTTSTIKSDS